MFSPISPQFVYMIHKEKERELERELELIRIAREQRAYETGGSLEKRQTWYAQASQWIKVNLFNRLSVSKRASSQQKTLADPCPGIPC